jgi:hypothetical protein
MVSTTRANEDTSAVINFDGEMTYGAFRFRVAKRKRSILMERGLFLLLRRFQDVAQTALSATVPMDDIRL